VASANLAYYNIMSIKIKFLVFVSFVLFGICVLKFGSLVLALDCSDPNAKLSGTDAGICYDQIESLKNQYTSAQTTNKKNLAQLRSQLDNLNKRVKAMVIQLDNFAKDIVKREIDLAFTKEIFEGKAKDHYTFLRLYDPITPFIFSDSASQAFQEISFRQKAADEDRKTMEKYGLDLAKLKTDKEALEKNKASLAVVQKQVSEQTVFLAGEVAKVESYLAVLSSRQQSFLAQKLESLGLSRSAYNMKGGCSSDINPFKSPGFSPAVGFFSFGVPNRVGMNQFGAKGRSEAGQDFEEILRAYYNADITRG